MARATRRNQSSLCRSTRAHRGASLLEMALTLMILMSLVLGMLDLGLAVHRAHVLSFAARVGVREAIVHGEYADRLGPWGPQPVSENVGGGTHELAGTLAPFLVGIDPNEVTMDVEWPDADNRVEARVRVTLSAPYTPMMTFLFGNPTFQLSGSSTMPIAH
jgi:hypothetical protein